MQEFIKYFLVNVGGLIIDYFAVLMALNYGIVYQQALFLGVILGGIFVFLLLTFWVFPTQKNHFSRIRIFSYISGMALVYVIRLGVMSLWYSAVDNWEQLGLICAYGTSFLINFAFQKVFYTKF